MARLWAALFFTVVLCHLAAAAEVPKLRVMQNLFIIGADMSKIDEATLDALVARGAQGFELPGTVSTPEDCKRLGRYLRSRGLPSGLNVAVDPLRDPSSLDPFVRRAGIEYLKSRIDCAVDLGATTMAGPLVLPWGGFYDTDSTLVLQDEILAAKLDAAVPALQEVADYAASKNIKLALEPLHRHEMHGLNTVEEAVPFLRRVGRKNFGFCMDSSHEIIDGWGPANYRKGLQQLHAEGYFLYAQVSAPSRGGIEEDSWIPWNEYLGLVREFGLDLVTIEIMQATPPFVARNGGGIRLSRRPFPDPYLTVERAVAAVRNRWAALFHCGGGLAAQGTDGLLPSTYVIP